MRKVMVFGVTAAVLSLAIVQVASSDVRDGLIAYWPLDEKDGDTWHDAVGNHDGDVEEVGDGGWTNDAHTRGGFAFSHSLVEIDDEDDINELPDGFTIAHWTYPEAGGAIMDKSGTDATRIQWYLLGDLRHHWGVGGGFGFSDGNPVPAWKEWYHFVWSHTPGESVVYRDGEEVGRGAQGDVPVTDANMYFGNRLPDEGRQEWFTGTLDEVGFWNRGLTPEEVEEVFKRGLSGLLAVAPQGKIASSWAAIKARRR